MSANQFNTLLIEPTSHADLVINALLPYALIKQGTAGKKLHFGVNNEKYCYILIKGHFAIYRQDDNRLMAYTSAPGIFGTVSLADYPLNIYLKALSPSSWGKVYNNDVHRLVTNANLWEPLCMHMMFVTSKLTSYASLLAAPTSYQLVCTQLIELNRENKIIKENVTAESYIRDKTNLSRSGIMNILSQLTKRGHIVMKRGYLLEIIHLPEDLRRGNKD